MLEYTVNKFEIQPQPQPIFMTPLAGTGPDQKVQFPAEARAQAPVDPYW